MTKEQLKKLIADTIDQHRDDIVQVADDIYKTPELGYKEFKSNQRVIEFLKNLDMSVEENIAVTGCRSRLNTEKTGPRIALMGELDALVVQDHPDATPEGNVHACGHNVQIAGLLGATIGLVKSGVLQHLDGQIDIMAVPAEEFIDIEYRDNLRAEGKIKYFGGKQELIHRGYFDDVDMSIMFHSLHMSEEGKECIVGPLSNGFIGKKVQFIGRESHAGSAPEDGINALNAAMLALNNIHAQRETFKDQDRVRVHPIITKGGDVANVVPGDVRMESYVRARSVEAMIEANKKVDRSLIAGAQAVGADVKITDIPGYFPILSYPELDNLFADNFESIRGQGTVIHGGDFTGSFDFGDISYLMPSLHPMIGGVKGGIHTCNFTMQDPELSYLATAKTMAMVVVDLLFDNAQTANEILANFQAPMTKEQYLEFMESIDKTETHAAQ